MTGSQLTLKLNVFYYYYQEIFSDPSIGRLLSEPYPSDKQIQETKKKRKWLKPILDVINSILGSLTGAIPGVDFIKEYKEMEEHGYEQSQEEYKI